MPAQQLIKVYADGTGDFTSLKTAIDTHVQNLITNDKALVFELSGTLSHSGSYIDFGSYTTDATRNITIKAKAGEEATGVAGAGTSFSSSTYIFVLRGEYVVIDGVELAGAGSGPALYASNNTTVKNALISADKTISDTAGASFENVVFFDCGEVNAPSGNGVYVRKANLHRCTLVASSTRGGYNGQIITRDADGVITQCLIINETTGGYDNYFQCTNVLNDYNADSEGNAPGSTTFTCSSSDVVDYAGENYNTKPSSTLYTAGPNGEPVGAVLVVSGGGITLTVDSGNYSINGTDTPTNANFKTGSASGNYLLTGADTYTSANFKTGSSSGNYLLTGAETTLKASLNITTTEGAYSLTGSLANLLIARKLLTETGSYNLTGTDVTLTVSTAGEILVIDSGVYSLSGTETILKADLNTKPLSGNYSYVGANTPIRFNSKIHIDSDTYALTGTGLNLFPHYGILMQSAIYSVAGAFVALKYSGDIAQKIGVVTSYFADNDISVGYKLNTITVTFKG